jgi:hypothetical protein
MTNEDNQFERIKQINGDAALHRLGGKPVVLLPNQRFRAADCDRQMTLLLHPSEHSGYTTRLFFQEQISGRGANWNQFSLLDNLWWSPSWNGVAAELPWLEILASHLRGVQ